MAEILSIVSGIAGLLTLTIEVSRITVSYISKIKNTTSSVQALLQELKGLKTVLNELDNLIDLLGPEELESVGATAVAFLSASVEYKVILTELRLELEKRNHQHPRYSQWSSLSWPFEEAKTKDIVSNLHRYHHTVEMALSRDTYLGVFKTLKETAALRQHYHDDRFAKVLQWLSASNMLQKQDELYSIHQPKTGDWFIKHPNVQAWLADNGHDNFLWCTGARKQIRNKTYELLADWKSRVAGSGKTVMMSILINRISRQHTGSNAAGQAFFFCDHQEKPKATDIIASLAKQLASQSKSVHPLLWNLYEDMAIVQRRPDLRQLEALAKSLCATFPLTFIIIDGLDECISWTERKLVLNSLQQLGGSSVKTMVTSRPNLEDLQNNLGSFPHVEIFASKTDVQEYLVHKLKSMLRKSLPANLEQQVISIIAARASGMFLMAVLLVEQISHERTVSRILKTLELLPAKIEEAYDVSMQRIAQQASPDKALAMRILQWVSHAKRPLRVEECLHALAIEREEDDTTLTQLDTQNLLEPENLIDVCAGLIQIEETGKTLRFVHSTAREFFSRKRAKMFPDAEEYIAFHCLTYLNFDIFSKGPCGSDTLLQQRIASYPFLEYAARHWADHAMGICNQEVHKLTYCLLVDPLLRASMLQVMCAPTYQYEHYSQKYPKLTTSLHVAARLGLMEAARRFLQHHNTVNRRISYSGRTPVEEAAKYGHVDMVLLLISEGAHLDDKGPKGSALQLAATEGHPDVISALLEHGADPNLNENTVETDYRSIDPSSGPALHRAANNGHMRIVQILLQGKADPNLSDYSKGTALHQAVSKGHEKICHLLLDNGAAVDILDSSGRTPLQQAAACGQKSIVQLLLRHGADVNIRDFCGGVPLQRAATNGDVAITRLLLDHGAQPDIPQQFGGSALQRAAALGHFDVLELLLGHGAIADAPNQYGGTALQRAAANGRERAVRLLLYHGADPNSLNSTGGTPLQWACSVGHKVIAEMLLQAGGDANASHPTVETHGTAIDRAHRNGHDSMLELFVHLEH